VTRSKDIGTAAETAVVRYLRVNGFAQAERRALAGVLDQGDITGTPGIAWEVKAGEKARHAGDAQITSWMTETEVERVNARADVGVLVVRRRSYGCARAGRWWAILQLGVLLDLTITGRDGTGDWNDHTTPTRLFLCDVVELLRGAGYGDPLPKAVPL
jgi:hypothetical protein